MHHTRENIAGLRTKGQAMIEYLILYTAVVVVVIFFFSGRFSFFGHAYDRTLERSANSIIVVVNKVIK